MNSTFPNPPQEQHGASPIAAPGEVDWGVLGLTTSVVGTLLTAGILAPVGMVISLFALRRHRRKSAVIGVIVGALGTMILTALICSAYLSYANVDPEVKEVLDQAPLRIAMRRLEQLAATQGQQPTFDAGQRAIADLRDRWGGQVLYVPFAESTQPPQPAWYALLAPGEDGEYLTLDDLLLLSKDAPSLEPEH